MQENWLKVETNLPDCADEENNCLSATEVESIEANLFNLTPPTGKNAESAEEWAKYGNQLWRTFQYQEAIVAFDKAFALNSEEYFLNYAKGLALIDLGWEEVKAILVPLTKGDLGGSYSEKLIEKAINQYDKRLREAIVAFEVEIKLASSPEYIPYEPYREMGKAYYYLLKYEQGLISFGKAIELKDDDFVLYLWQGEILAELGRYDEAISSYDQALKIKPDNVYAWNNRGNSLAILQKYEQAITSFDQAINFKPDHVNAWVARGIAYYQLGNKAQAIKDLQTVAQLAQQQNIPQLYQLALRWIQKIQSEL